MNLEKTVHLYRASKAEPKSCSNSHSMPVIPDLSCNIITGVALGQTFQGPFGSLVSNKWRPSILFWGPHLVFLESFYIRYWNESTFSRAILALGLNILWASPNFEGHWPKAPALFQCVFQSWLCCQSCTQSLMTLKKKKKKKCKADQISLTHEKSSPWFISYCMIKMWDVTSTWDGTGPIVITCKTLNSFIGFCQVWYVYYPYS